MQGIGVSGVFRQVSTFPLVEIEYTQEHCMRGKDQPDDSGE